MSSKNIPENSIKSEARRYRDIGDIEIYKVHVQKVTKQRKFEYLRQILTEWTVLFITDEQVFIANIHKEMLANIILK